MKKRIVWRILVSAAAVSCILLSCKKSGTAERQNGAEGVPALASVYPEFGRNRSINITWFEQGWTGPVEGLDFVAPEIEKRTNLRMGYEPMTVPTGDDYHQRLNLMLAANEVPDAFFGGIDYYTRVVYEKLGQNGNIWDLTEIIKDYKNLYELVYPELNLYRAVDGKNYFIPTQTGRGYETLNEPPFGPWLRQDFLDKLGMAYPKTPDEFYTYLKRATTELTVNGSPVRGLLLGENIDGANKIWEMFVPLLGSHDSWEMPFDPNDNFRVKNYLFTNSPELMAGMKFLNKLSREGLLDREVLTIKTPQFQEKGTSGLYAAMTATYWDMNTFTDVTREEIPEIFWVTPPPIYANDTVRKARERPWTDWVGCWSSLIINKKVDEETVRHLLAAMDYFVGQEGQLLLQAGIEGVSYEWNTDGTYKFTDKFKVDTGDLDWNKAAAYGVGYYAQLVNNTPVIAPLQESPPLLLRADNYKSWQNQKEIQDLYDKHMEPPLDYYFLQGDVEKERFGAIRDLRFEFLAGIVAARSETEVENLVNKWARDCVSLGINDILAERQAAMDAIIAGSK